MTSLRGVADQIRTVFHSLRYRGVVDVISRRRPPHARVFPVHRDVVVATHD